MTISEWLIEATKTFKLAGIDSNRLDAEIILAHSLRKSRTYLHAHLDEEIDPRLKDIADVRAEMRAERTPIAYIIGHKEFYGRRFKVTPSTLIPRPETETLIELFLKHTETEIGTKYVVDVGTGSGCIGVTIKLERPNFNVTLTDISKNALTVAETNARSLSANVSLLRSDLLASYPGIPDYIIANLPYVDPLWERSPETEFEPAEALFADDSGMALIKKLIAQAAAIQNPGGRLYLEADSVQHDTIISTAEQFGYSHVETDWYALCLEKR